MRVCGKGSKKGLWERQLEGGSHFGKEDDSKEGSESRVETCGRNSGRAASEPHTGSGAGMGQGRGRKCFVHNLSIARMKDYF